LQLRTLKTKDQTAKDHLIGRWKTKKKPFQDVLERAKKPQKTKSYEKLILIKLITPFW